MSNHQHLENGMRWRIVRRLEAGQSQFQIYRFQCNNDIVFNLWKQLHNIGSLQKKPGKGRPKRITICQLQRDITGLLQLISCLVTSMRPKLQVSRDTLSRNLHKRGLFARKPDDCILLASPLSLMQRSLPLEWPLSSLMCPGLTQAPILDLLSQGEAGTYYLSSNVLEIDHYSEGLVMPECEV